MYETDYIEKILSIEQKIKFYKKHIEFNKLKIKKYYERIDKILKIKNYDDFDHNRILIDKLYEKIGKKNEYNTEVSELIDRYYTIIKIYKKRSKYSLG